MICSKCKRQLDESNAVVNGYVCRGCGKLNRFKEETLHCLEKPKIKRPLHHKTSKQTSKGREMEMKKKNKGRKA